MAYYNKLYVTINQPPHVLTLQLLEALLPPREIITPPTGEDVEEVNLHDYTQQDQTQDRQRAGHGAHHAHGGGEEDGGPSVQCAHQ